MRCSSRAPTACSDNELFQFSELVRKGAEVSPRGLERRMLRAAALVFLKDGENLHGIAALKHPDAAHRKSVSDKSGVELPAGEWPYELGWIFVEQSLRGQGHSRALVTCAIEAAGREAGVFATSRADNEAMHRTLTRTGFVSRGRAYRSDRGEYDLMLFLRQVTH